MPVLVLRDQRTIQRKKVKEAEDNLKKIKHNKIHQIASKKKKYKVRRKKKGDEGTRISTQNVERYISSNI